MLCCVNVKIYCVNTILWGKINDAVNSVIDNITLEDMYKWQNKDIKDNNV